MSRPIPRELAKAVKLVILDVDGVMTDGGILAAVDAHGEPFELKRFEITDGLGVKMLVWAGINVYMVSGRRSPVNAVRATELGIEYREAHGGYKWSLVDELRKHHGLEWMEICCICDDLADLPLLRNAGLPVAVANAVPEVKAAAVWETVRSGGNGAVRELAEALLRARGDWDRLVSDYERDRSGPPRGQD
ncbi:MAG TPA: HAD hydrolase family protein [Longimicrobiales bacterium]|nr:HAD hydrolase family protein [Longimicrobiales bacterium]